MMLRGKWIILITFVVVLLATILITNLMDPVYKATSDVLLNPAELRSSLFLDGARNDGAKNITQNELAILNSRSLADSVAERLRRQKYMEPGKSGLIPIVQATEDQPAGENLASSGSCFRAGLGRCGF